MLATTESSVELEHLLQQSQLLWKEPSYERLLQRYVEILKESLTLERASLFFLRTINGKLNIQPAGLSFRAAPAVLGGDILCESLATLQLKSPEFKQGCASFTSQGRTFHFVLLGDPASDWQALVWQMGDTQFHTRLWLDFFSKQLQSASVWFQRLDRTQALLYKDDLTGVYNSRYLELAIETEIRRSQRFQTSFCLLFVDLDGFKTVNDQFGHMNGSMVLKQVSDVLRETSREVDSVIRYGGDEFVIILLGANPNTGMLAGERMRRKIEDARFYLDNGSYISLTASIGVASFPEHAKDRETLLRIADEMMYQSKKSGKNRVSLYQLTTREEPSEQGVSR